MSRYMAEFVGTFVLIFAGCGSAVLAGSQIGTAGIALTFGLTLLALVYAIGYISGCHINPAVTIGALICRKISGLRAIGYIVAQILGGIAAAAVLLAVANGAPGGYDAAAKGFAANGYGDHSPGQYTLASAFLIEVVLTFFLVLTVLGATDVKAPVGFAGIAIGLVLAVGNLVAIPVTNASINPARSIGPAVFVGGWALSQLWLFIVAPLVGGAIAAGVYLVLTHSESRMTIRKGEEALPSQQAERGGLTPPMPS